MGVECTLAVIGTGGPCPCRALRAYSMAALLNIPAASVPRFACSGLNWKTPREALAGQRGQSDRWHAVARYCLAGPEERDKWEEEGILTQGEKRGRVSGVSRAPSPLLAQEDPHQSEATRFTLLARKRVSRPCK
eukprot:1185960-Prorocentrum_minimum.AAC.5